MLENRGGARRGIISEGEKMEKLTEVTSEE